MQAILASLLLLGILLSPGFASADPLSYGSQFPETALSLPNDPADASYLGLKNPTSFTLSRIKGDIVLVELLNVHCPHCQMQAPSYNELFKDIAASETARDSIKMLGIAVGNLPSEVETFRKTYQVAFPIVADADFSIWRTVYGQATPYTVYVRQTRPGQPGVVAGSHLGLNTHYKHLLAELIKLAGIPPAEMIAHAAATAQSSQILDQLFSDAELEYRIRTAFINTGGGIRSFSVIPLRSGRRVYTARMQVGDQQRTLFAEVVSRPSVCDICHDVHFIYVFDIQGRIFGFESLQLTKYGNVNWNAKEISTMRDRLLGKSLLQKHSYNPQVDAISSATITSALIFDSLNQGRALLDELKEKGY
jgi:peroxiredoxin